MDISKTIIGTDYLMLLIILILIGTDQNTKIYSYFIRLVVKLFSVFETNCVNRKRRNVALEECLKLDQ